VAEDVGERFAGLQAGQGSVKSGLLLNGEHRFGVSQNPGARAPENMGKQQLKIEQRDA
jgi:hypothetical protein